MGEIQVVTLITFGLQLIIGGLVTITTKWVQNSNKNIKEINGKLEHLNLARETLFSTSKNIKEDVEELKEIAKDHYGRINDLELFTGKVRTVHNIHHPGEL